MLALRPQYRDAGSRRVAPGMRTHVRAIEDRLGRVAAPSQTRRRCVFCREPGKVTLEHMIASWLARIHRVTCTCASLAGRTTNPNGTYARGALAI
jgi:hypothetical protein